MSQAKIHEKAFSSDADQRREGARLLTWEYYRLEDKETAWKDLHRLTRDQDSQVREQAAIALGSAFQFVPDKKAAWKDLRTLFRDQDSHVRGEAAKALGVAFQNVPDKKAAWKDLHTLSRDQDSYVRANAALALEEAFQDVPDKEAAWIDLHRLTEDQDHYVRCGAADALCAAFPNVPDKVAAWKDLRRLTIDQDSWVRGEAAGALGWVFQNVPDKEAAWKDLHRLTQDQESYLRSKAADALGAAFQNVPDKEAAWKDLHRLTQDQESHLRWKVAGALGAAFQNVPDKEAAWKDLHRLIRDQDTAVRREATGITGAVFQNVPDKEAAWKDLIRLTGDQDDFVRSASYHSLGRISIFKATESDGEFKVHLEEAIEFFRKSSEEAEYFNPAVFCLPFYQSLHSLLFTEVPRQDEVDRYLAEAKGALEASESKEVLLEAVNNLSKALQEVRAYSVDDIVLRRRDLKSYTKYCLQTAECLREARSKAPLASKIVDYTLVEKSIPILDQKIKTLFRDVESTAGELCKSSKGTDLEAFGRDAYESTRGLNKVESWIVADRYLEEIVPLLKGHCSRLPKEAQAYLKILVDSQDSASLEQRFDTLKSVLLASLVQGGNDDRLVKELKELLDLHLKNIEFAILNLNTSSGDARKDLYDLKNQIDGLQREIESQGLAKKDLAEALDKKDQAMIERLEKMREKMLRAVRETTQLNASKRDVETILKELDSQDHLKKRDALGIIADLSSLAGIALSILL